MRQGELANLARHIGALRRPIPKGRPEPVRHRIDPRLPDELGDRATVDRAGALRRKDQVRPVRQRARLVQNLHRSRRQRNTMLALRLHPLRRYRPRRRCKVDLVPCRKPDLPRPARRQHQKLEGEHRRTVSIRRRPQAQVFRQPVRRASQRFSGTVNRSEMTRVALRGSRPSMDNNPKPIVAAPAISYRSIGSAVSIR